MWKQRFGCAAAALARPPDLLRAPNTRDPLGHANSTAFLTRHTKYFISAKHKAVLSLVISFTQQSLLLLYNRRTAAHQRQRGKKKPKQSVPSRLSLASQNTRFRHRSRNLSVSPCSETWSVWRTRTHVVNLCLWSWLQSSLGPDADVNAQEGRGGEKPANLAFCFAVFPSRSRPVGALPAGGEAVETQAPAPPLGPCKHYITVTQLA